MLECVVNISEGRDAGILSALSDACAASLLDLHTDPDHNRSVFTLAGPEVQADVRQLARTAIDALDIRRHFGAHPRLGVVDVVPFVDLADDGGPEAVKARDAFVGWLSTEHQVPCFLYGPERSLPEVRKHAFNDLAPDAGPALLHPTAGACAAGARGALVAYNVWLKGSDLAAAQEIARAIRGPHLRALGLQLGDEVQVSCNLVAPTLLGPGDAFDAITARAEATRAELVGLVPQAILNAEPVDRWQQLDLGPEKTIESRLAHKTTP